MSGTETGWITADKTELYAKYWAPEGEARAVVALVHGLGEHCGRYQHVAEMLNGNGIALYGFDHRGHGRSAGKQGFIPSYEVLMEEADLLLKHVSKQFPGRPVFLYGHSWGGNVVANYLIRRQPDVHGALITGPWLRLTNPLSGFMLFTIRLMSWLLPGLQQDNEIKAEQLSHSADAVKAYLDDRLVHGKVTPRLLAESMRAGEYAIDNAERITVPMLLMHGEDDQITSPGGTRAFSENALAEKTVKIYEGMLHEVHNEVGNGQVLADMLEFFIQYSTTKRG